MDEDVSNIPTTATFAPVEQMEELSVVNVTEYFEAQGECPPTSDGDVNKLERALGINFKVPSPAAVQKVLLAK